MKQITKSLLCIAMLCTTVASSKVVPYISIRSQSENAARELVLWQTQINLSCQDDFYSSFSITPEYTRSFRSSRLAQVLFNDALSTNCCSSSDCASFKVQGSAVINRDPRALLADNFALPLDYSSVVQIKPTVENFLVDLNAYLGLDHWVQGLYFRIHAPVVHTRWNLGLCEKISTPGIMNSPTGYYNSALEGSGTTDDPYYGLLRSNLVGTFEGYVSRCEIPTIDGIAFQPLRNARMSKCTQKDTALSDVQMALGWNFWQSECYHFGVNIRGAAPTGSRPSGQYLFEPIVGNGKHWELGAGITGHWTLWRSCDECKEFNVYLDANVTHMFKTCQYRTFDMCGKPLSRYMLATRMKTPATDIQTLAETAPSYQFYNTFAAVANLSTIPVDVSAAVQADIALKFAYTYNCFQFDLGYEFWGRSCEEICPHCDTSCFDNCCPTIPTGEVWALKGDSFVYGFVNEERGLSPVALSSSQRDASIFCGTNNYNRTSPAWILNPGADNAQPAYIIEKTEINNMPGGIVGNLAQMYSSFDPYVFNTAHTKQWDIDNAQSRGISHKLFTNVGYAWKDYERCTEGCCWNCTPYLGLGAEVEFGKTDKCCASANPTCTTKNPLPEPVTRNGCGCTTTYCSSNTNCTTSCCKTKCCCTDAAVSQWGIWVKGGVSFN